MFKKKPVVKVDQTKPEPVPEQVPELEPVPEPQTIQVLSFQLERGYVYFLDEENNIQRLKVN